MLLGAAPLPLPRRLDAVASHAIGLPYEGLVSPERTTHDTHLGRNHEARVEADAKLADDVDVLALVLRVGLPKLLRAGVGDGTEVLVELLLGHANAVVAYRNAAGLLIKGQPDSKLGLVDTEVRVLDCLEAQLVEGIRGVGDELAQEDLLVGVDRVDHEVEQLLALCLELLHRSCGPFPQRQRRGLASHPPHVYQGRFYPPAHHANAGKPKILAIHT